MNPMKRTVLLALVLGLPVTLGGCADYLNNRDTVSFGAGDSQAWNIATQTVKPWNRDSHDTSIETDGAVVAAAQKRRLILPAGAGSGAAAASTAATPAAQ